jgi:hypothetical protein
MIISRQRQFFFLRLLFGWLLLGSSVRSAEQHVFPEDDGIEFWDNFGTNLAIDGDWAVAGVPNDSMNGISRVGSAYVLKRVAGSWKSQAKLLLPASQWADSIQFGQAVAIRGDLLAVMRHDHVSKGSRIQLYRRHGDVWDRETELVGPAGNTYRTLFRSSVVIGEDCIVSACVAASPPQAIVYHRLSSAGWQQEQTIQPSPQNVGFGSSLALEGGVLLVGVPGSPFGGLGGVNEYRLTAGIWQLNRFIQPTDGVSGDQFGVCVKMSAGRALIGASHLNSTLKTNGGKVYLYQVSDSPWTLLRTFGGDQTLKVEDDSDLALSENRALFASRSTNSVRELQLTAQSAAEWVLRQVPFATGFHGFPQTALALGVDSGLVGFDKRSGTLTGKLVELKGEPDLVAGAVIVPRLTHQASSSHFGGAGMVISGDLAVASLPTYRGQELGTAAYSIIEKRDGLWTLVKTLYVPLQLSYNGFNAYRTVLAVDGHRVVISEPSFSWSSPTKPGRVLVYERGADGLWPSDPSLIIPSPLGQTSGVSFGPQIAISGDRLAVSEVESSRSIFRVRLYRLTSGMVLPTGVLELQGSLITHHFGRSLALDGDTLAVSDASEDESAYGLGEVLIYNLKGDANKLTATVKSAVGSSRSYFGREIHLDRGVLAVTTDAWVETFQLLRGKWRPLAPIPVPSIGNSAYSLKTLTLDDGHLVIGTHEDARLYSLNAGAWYFIDSLPLQESRLDLQVVGNRDTLLFSGGIDRGLTFQTTGRIVATENALAASRVAEFTSRGGIVLGELPIRFNTTVTIPFQNRSSRTLRVQAIQATDISPTNNSFKGVEFKPVTLAPGESTSMLVTLYPPVSGHYSVSLKVVHDDPTLGESLIGLSHSATSTISPLTMDADKAARLAALGEEVLLEPLIFGTRYYTCRWFKDGRLLAGRTQNVLYIPKARPQDAGRYRLELSRPGASPISCEMLLGVYGRQFTTQELAPDKAVKFQVPVWGPGVRVKWNTEESWNVRGVHTPTLSIQRPEMWLEVSPFQVDATVTMADAQVTGFFATLYLKHRPVLHVTTRSHLVLGDPTTLFAYLDGVSGADITVEGLPPGLAYQTTGFGIEGVPTQTGTYRYTVRGRTTRGDEAEPVTRTITVVATVEEVPHLYGPAATMVGQFSISLPPPDEASSRPGLLTVRTTNGQSYSGELRLGRDIRRFTGSLEQTEEVGRRISQVSLKPLLGYQAATLHLEQNAPGEGEMASMLASLEMTPFEGDPLLFNGFELLPTVRSVKEVRPFITGQYTYLLQAVDAAQPGLETAATGFGSLKLTESLTATSVATLPDGTSMTFSAPLVTSVPAGGFWVMPVVQSLSHGGHIAGLIGWNQTSNPADPGTMIGDLSMTRPPNPRSRVYPEGFQDKWLSLRGDRFYLPNDPAHPLGGGADDPSPLFILDNGYHDSDLPLTEPIHSSLRLSPNLKKGIFTANPHSLKLDFYSQLGFFSGKFTVNDLLPGSETRRISRVVDFWGMIVPGIRKGGGLFLLKQLNDPTAEPPITSTNARIHAGNVLLE